LSDAAAAAAHEAGMAEMSAKFRELGGEVYVGKTSMANKDSG
jgi:hypothetical protein